ncbi:MAG: hypothetical protein RSC10_07715 [Longicatena sp.]
MKIKKVICVLCLLILSGCATTVKADKKLVCSFESKNEKAILNIKEEVTFNEKNDQLISRKSEIAYSNLEVNPTTNSIYLDLKNKANLVGQIQGAEVSAFNKKDGFSFIETWNYEKVDVQKALDIDEEQKVFIDNNKYSIKKMKDNFASLNYECNTTKVD